MFRTPGAARVMTGWVILVDQPRDFPNADTPHKVITTRDYLARPKLFAGARPGEGHQPVAVLQLSVEGLLRLAARRGARPSRDPDRRDDARAARAEALRAVAAGTAGGADRRRAQGAGDRADDVRPVVLLRLRPGPAFRGVRPAPVRLVPLPGDRGHHHARQAVEDRPAARPAARQARAGGRGVLPQEPASPHPARLAQSARPRRSREYSLAVLHDPQEALPPSSPETLQALPEDRRKAVGRGRAHHPQAARRARRVRRPLHPRDDLDRQLHLSLRPARPQRRHAGHRRSAVDDPLHQQGLSARASGGAWRARAADRDAGRGRGSRTRPSGCSAGRWW